MKAAMQQKFGGECVALTEVPSWTQKFKQCVPWRSDCYSLIAFVRKTTSPFGADVIYLSYGRPLIVVPCIIPIRAVSDNAYCLSMVKSGICSLEWLVMVGSDAIGERFLPRTAKATSKWSYIEHWFLLMLYLLFESICEQNTIVAICYLPWRWCCWMGTGVNIMIAWITHFGDLIFWRSSIFQQLTCTAYRGGLPVMANRFVHVSSVNFLTNIMCQTTQSSMCLLLSFIRNIKLLSEVRSRVDFHYRTWEREKRYLSRGHFSEIWLHGPSTRCY